LMWMVMKRSLLRNAHSWAHVGAQPEEVAVVARQISSIKPTPLSISQNRRLRLRTRKSFAMSE
jgi:hypothetical protein